MEISEGLGHPGNKEAALLGGFLAHSDIPSHFNLGEESEYKRIRPGEAAAQRDMEQWPHSNNGPAAFVRSVI